MVEGSRAADHGPGMARSPTGQSAFLVGSLASEGSHVPYLLHGAPSGTKHGSFLCICYVYGIKLEMAFDHFLTSSEPGPQALEAEP